LSIRKNNITQNSYSKIFEMICESPLDVTFVFVLIDFQIPVVVSKRIKIAINIKMPDIGMKKESVIDISCSL